MREVQPAKYLFCEEKGVARSESRYPRGYSSVYFAKERVSKLVLLGVC